MAPYIPSVNRKGFTAQGDKIVLLGDGRVGKTAIFRQLKDEIFIEDYMPTYAADKAIHLIDIGGRVVKIELCDTGGEERYADIIRFHYKNADCIILCYDITDQRTLQSCWKRWRLAVYDNCNTLPCLILCGTKYDQRNDRKVQQREVETMAAKLQATALFRRVDTVETSSKENYQVRELLYMAASVLISYEPAEYGQYSIKVGDMIEVRTPYGNQTATVTKTTDRALTVTTIAKGEKLTIKNPQNNIVEVINTVSYKERSEDKINLELEEAVPQSSCCTLL